MYAIRSYYAIFHLRLAGRQNTEHAMTLRYLGHSLFKVKNYKEALSNLKRAVDLQPDDKESLFAMGECFHEIGRITSYNVCYTKLLRRSLAIRHRYRRPRVQRGGARAGYVPVIPDARPYQAAAELQPGPDLPGRLEPYRRYPLRRAGRRP